MLDNVSQALHVALVHLGGFGSFFISSTAGGQDVQSPLLEVSIIISNTYRGIRSQIYSHEGQGE